MKGKTKRRKDEGVVASLKKIQILIADDHKIVRDGLKTLINKKGTAVRVVAEADNGRQAVELARQAHPDVVLMDVIMPNMNGIDATRAIVKNIPGVRVIGLSMHDEKRYVLGMFEAGASGYLLKDCSFNELHTAIRDVVGGKLYLSPQISDMVISEYINRTQNHSYSPCAILTPREREVLQLYSEGMVSKEIAAHLNICTKTIQTHRLNLERKLNLHGIAELTKYAIREGLVSIER